MRNKVFLGGTCNNSLWREELIKKLNCTYFNPVVDNWTEECFKEELIQRENCEYCLYVITPKIYGYYSIAEVVDDSKNKPNKTLFCVLKDYEGESFDDFKIKSFKAIEKMILKNGARCFNNLEEIAIFLNNN